MPTDTSKRRQLLQALATAGALGVAGCFGDGDVEEDPLEDDGGDDGSSSSDDGSGSSDDGSGGDGNEDAQYQMDVGTSAGGTMDVGLGVEQAVAEVSDILNYSTVESPGYIGTAYRMNEDAFDAGFVDVNTMNKARTQTDMFEENPVDQLPWYGFFAFPYSIYIMARDGTGIETFDDLAGANVYPAEPGYTTRATSLDVWSQEPTADVYEEMNIIDMDVADAPGAMEEERIDAAIAYGTKGIGNTGWVVEYDARVDVHYVQHTDALIESIEMFPGASLGRFDENPAEAFVWDQDIGTDEIVTWNFSPTISFHPETEDEAVYELCRIAGEENDAIREAEQRFTPESPEDLVSAPLENYPYHPGAAQYYKDQGVWNDDWVIGDRDNVGEYFE